MKIYFDGKIVNKDQVLIDPFSPSVLYGVTVFEGIRYYHDQLNNQLLGFRLNDHYVRFINSIKVLSIRFEITYDDYVSAIHQTILSNKLFEDVYVRTSLILDGEGSWHSLDSAKLMISATPRTTQSTALKGGQRVMITHWQRISDNQMPPRVKVGANYVNSRMAFLDAKQKGFDNAIILNKDGFVSEGPGACIFIVRHGALITPSINQSILESITRNTVIAIAKNLKIEIVERAIDKSELYVCDEAFYTGTAAEITPILQIDSFTVGNGNPGYVTSKIYEEFVKITRGKHSNYRSWNTLIHD